MALSNIVFTRAASGDIPISHVTNNPSKQSTMGDKYTFPAGIANSVISVQPFNIRFFRKEITVYLIGNSW